MTEGTIAHVIVITGNKGLKLFHGRTILRRIKIVKRKNVNGQDYADKHAAAIASLERVGLLAESGVRLECKTFARDGASVELLIEPSAGQDRYSSKEVIAIRFALRNGGYAFWVPDKDLDKFPCGYFGPNGEQCRMVAVLSFENQAHEKRGQSFVLCETSEAMNYASISAETRTLRPGEVLGSAAWRRRVYKTGPDIYESRMAFIEETLKSLLGTGHIFQGKSVPKCASHEEQAELPWFFILLATENGFGIFGTAGRSEIVGCVWYELGLDVGVPIGVFRNNEGLARDLVNIVVKLADDLACLDERYNPLVCDPVAMTIMRCNMMICYQQAGHYQIGPKQGTKKVSDVHGKFWTPPITSLKTAEILREYNYSVLTMLGPLEKHGGSANKLFYGPASWSTNGPKGDRKLYTYVVEEKPKAKPTAESGEPKRKREGKRARRKRQILAGSYATKTPRKVEEPLISKQDGDLVGLRIGVLWEGGTHADVKEDRWFFGFVYAYNPDERKHRIIYDDFAYEDEYLNALKYKLQAPTLEGIVEITGPEWVPHAELVAREEELRKSGKGLRSKRKRGDYWRSPWDAGL